MLLPLVLFSYSLIFVREGLGNPAIKFEEIGAKNVKLRDAASSDNNLMADDDQSGDSDYYYSYYSYEDDQDDGHIREHLYDQITKTDDPINLLHPTSINSCTKKETSLTKSLSTKKHKHSRGKEEKNSSFFKHEQEMNNYGRHRKSSLRRGKPLKENLQLSDLSNDEFEEERENSETLEHECKSKSEDESCNHDFSCNLGRTKTFTTWKTIWTTVEKVITYSHDNGHCSVITTHIPQREIIEVIPEFKPAFTSFEQCFFGCPCYQINSVSTIFVLPIASQITGCNGQVITATAAILPEIGVRPNLDVVCPSVITVTAQTFCTSIVICNPVPQSTTISSLSGSSTLTSSASTSSSSSSIKSSGSSSSKGVVTIGLRGSGDTMSASASRDIASGSSIFITFLLGLVVMILF